MIPNHYETLQIDRYAAKLEIKKAYRKLALYWHPDKNKSHEAHNKFISINEAYLILYDDEARNKYNIEYDLYFVKADEENVEFVHGDHEKANNYKSNHVQYSYKDPDLNNWSTSAKNQAEKYAAMSFSDFARLFGEVLIETGKQGGTAIIYAISAIIGASSFFSFISGLRYGDYPQILLSILFFGLSILGFTLTSKRYKS